MSESSQAMEGPLSFKIGTVANETQNYITRLGTSNIRKNV